MKNIAMGVVVRDGKILIQKRFRRGQGMVFEFPGGSIDPGESGNQAAIRELWEETGLIDLKLLGSHQAFFWLEPSAIPLNDFYPADIDFIENHLSQYT